MELTKVMRDKKIFKLEEVADILKVDIDMVKDFIESNDLTAIGKKKDSIRDIDLNRFINGDRMLIQNEGGPIDLEGNQRYHAPYLIETEELNNEEWNIMVKNGIKELTPYWNESRKKWCLALSLGYGENHKRIRKVITANTKNELWIKYGEFQFSNTALPIEDISNVARNTKADMLFKDYIIKYLDEVKGETSSRTYDSKINLARHIINGIGKYKMSELNVHILKKFINGLTEKNYEKGKKTHYFSQSTINKIYDVLHGIIKDASDEEGDGILQKDYMRNIKKPRSKQHKDKEEQALSKDELKKISDVIKDNKMISTWVHIMMYTGARPSEALALKFSDIDYKNSVIKINKTLSQEQDHDVASQKRKGAPKPIITNLKNDHGRSKVDYQTRELKVSKNLLDITKEWENYVKSNTKLMKMKNDNGTEEYMFCGSKGQLWLYRNYRQAYGRILERVGLDISEFNPYRFRHNFCTECLRKGIDVKTVQCLMGDNTPDMVLKVYANMNKDDVFKGSKILSEHIDKILGHEK